MTGFYAYFLRFCANGGVRINGWLLIGFFLKLDSTKKFCFDAGRYKIFVDISFICSFLNKHVPFVSNIEGIECQENISRVALEYYKM